MFSSVALTAAENMDVGLAGPLKCPGNYNAVRGQFLPAYRADPFYLLVWRIAVRAAVDLHHTVRFPGEEYRLYPFFPCQSCSAYRTCSVEYRGSILFYALKASGMLSCKKKQEYNNYGPGNYGNNNGKNVVHYSPLSVKYRGGYIIYYCNTYRESR